MYLDESGCQLWSPQVIATAGEQNALSRPSDNGRISILGVATGQKLQVCTGLWQFQSESYIKVIDWIAEQTSETLGQLDG